MAPGCGVPGELGSSPSTGAQSTPTEKPMGHRPFLLSLTAHRLAGPLPL